MEWWFGFFFVKIWKNIIKAAVNYTLLPVSPYLLIIKYTVNYLYRVPNYVRNNPNHNGN